MIGDLLEFIEAHPELADMTLPELRAWAEAEDAESRALSDMYSRELAEGRAAFKALEPYLSGGMTTGAALGIMRRVEGPDSPALQAVERFIASHPFLRAEGVA